MMNNYPITKNSAAVNRVDNHDVIVFVIVTQSIVNHIVPVPMQYSIMGRSMAKTKQNLYKRHIKKFGYLLGWVLVLLFNKETPVQTS